MKTISVNDIPVEAITAARDAMADEYLSTNMALEQPSLIVRLHKKRVKKRIATIGLHLSKLDAWLKEIKT